MIATIIPEKKMHYPVMLNEVINIISPLYGGTFIDCTFGHGGYTKKILGYKDTNVIALDRDNEVKPENLDQENKNANGLENFNIEEETLELFNSDDSTDKEEPISFDTNENNTEDDDEFEIPAFLRRQKN